ncbi:MAG: leucine-rich repeat domain-containing protein, partial [Clostridia bacterium]|nr:leucine-rich repeat domain-containing protein [Clostridia bacterium]
MTTKQPSKRQTVQPPAAHSLAKHLCAAVLFLCCLAGSLQVSPALATSQEVSHSYTVINNVFFLESGVQAIGYVREEMAAETEGLLFSDALEIYAWAGYDDYYRHREPLNEVVLPSSLRLIGSSAFMDIHAGRLRWPEQITRIMDYALTESYLEEIIFHAGVTEFSQYSFCGCNGTKWFIVEEGNPAIKAVDGVLYTADGKTLLRYPPQKAGGHFDVPAGVENIASYAFDGCANLYSISLPMGVKTIGWSAFGECFQLKSIAIPLTLREIQPYAFSDCITLSALHLPKGVQVTCDPEIVAEHNQWGGNEWKPEEYVCYNTPMLESYPDWDWCKVQCARQSSIVSPDGDPSASGTPDEAEPAPDYQEIWPEIPAIFNPENARDLVKIYAEASQGSKVLGSFACGSTVEVAGWKEGWYLVWWRRDCDEGAPE